MIVTAVAEAGEPRTCHSTPVVIRVRLRRAVVVLRRASEPRALADHVSDREGERGRDPLVEGHLEANRRGAKRGRQQAVLVLVDDEAVFVDAVRTPAAARGAERQNPRRPRTGVPSGLSKEVNGHDPIDLVVDTGAEQMVLSQETAAAMAVPAITTTISAGVGEVGVRGLDLGRVDTLEIGSLVVSNVPAIIKNPPLDGLPRQRVRDSISPVAFGLSAVIDYENHHMVLARRLPDGPADIELPMRVNRLAVVRGIVNEEHPRSFVVDTGGEVVSLSIGTVGSLGLVPPRHIPLQVYGTSGWDQDAFLLPGVQLAFNEIMYDNFSVVVLNLHRPSALLGFHIGGIVGHTFLRNYRVEIDIDRSMLRLTRL